MHLATPGLIYGFIALATPSVLNAQPQVSKGVAARAMMATGDWSVGYPIGAEFGGVMWIDRASRIQVADGVFRINLRWPVRFPALNNNRHDHEQAETWAVNCRTAEYKHLGWYANNGIIRTREKVLGGANWRDLDRSSVVYMEACNPPKLSEPISANSAEIGPAISKTPSEKCSELGFTQGTQEFGQCVSMLRE